MARDLLTLKPDPPSSLDARTSHDSYSADRTVVWISVTYYNTAISISLLRPVILSKTLTLENVSETLSSFQAQKPTP
jgi:hypothetical protein